MQKSEWKKYGIDVSDHQDPKDVPYKDADFVIVKVSEGESFHAHRAEEHIKRTRDAGKTLGLYHFYRYGHDHKKQGASFLHLCQKFDLGPGDLYPCLDIEQGPYKITPSNAWNHPCLAIAEALEEVYGGCIPYVNKRDFQLMLSPDWIMDRPLWFAQYPKDGELSAPKQPAIWQHRVGPFERNGAPGYFADILDQNLAIAELPLIEAEEEPMVKVLAHVANSQAAEMREKIRQTKKT